VVDIAKCCAKYLLEEFQAASPFYFRMLGPRTYSAADIKTAVEEVTGRQVQLELVEKDQLPAYWGQIVPEHLVEDFVGMTLSSLPGGVGEQDMIYGGDAVVGSIELVDGLRGVSKQG
jgi:hypothetical protein